MYNSNIKTLIKKLESINELNKPIATTYSDIIDKIELAEDYNIDLRHTLELDDEDFYINIKEIDEKTKLIKNYAVGINHKHEGGKEIVKGFSGNIDDLINDYKNLLN